MPFSEILPDADNVVNAPVFAVPAPIGVLLIEPVEIATPPIVPPVNAIFEPVTEFAPWATVPPKFVVPLIVFVPVALPMVLRAAVPAPNEFVKLAPVPIVEAPLDVSVVNAPVLPLIGLFVMPPAVRFPVTEADASVASPLEESVVNAPVLPLIGLFVMPPAVRFPVTDADASVASPLVDSVVNDPAEAPPVMSVRNATVPEAFGKVIVLAAVGSVIANVVWNALLVAPSNTSGVAP